MRSRLGRAAPSDGGNNAQRSGVFDSAMRARPLLSTLPPPSSPSARAGQWARLGVATAAALGAAVLMRSWSGTVPLALWIPSGLLLLSAVLLHHGEVGSQLIARSAWWANLVLGTLLAIRASGEDRRIGVSLALCTGTALLAMGRLGLDELEGSAFRPVAFRTTLTLGMIMAVADAQALALFGALKLQDGGWKERTADNAPQAALLLASAALLVLAIAGLYRLRVWGLLLATLCAAGVAGLSITNAYDLPEPLAKGLALTSAVQVLLPVPIVLAIVRGGVAPAGAPSRLARLAPVAVVGLMMVASALRAVLHDRALLGG